MNENVIQEKATLVTAIAEKIKAANSTVVVEYRGLSVSEITDLRRKLGAENVELKVYKNSMVQRAAVEAGMDGLTDSLVGPNAIAFGSDAVAPARVLAKFAENHKNLVLKSGIVEGKVVDVNTLQSLSKLPNREGMISMLLGCLQSPVRSFACVVKAVADAKESV